MQFRYIKPIEEWPPAGQQLVAIAELIQGWWWLTLIIVVGVIVFFRLTLNNYVGEFRPMLDKIPPFSLYRQFAAARLMETMGLLLPMAWYLKMR